MQEPKRAEPGLGRCGACICRQASRRGVDPYQDRRAGCSGYDLLSAGDGKEVVMTKPLASGAATVACSVNTATAPFLPPEKLETDLARVRTYWEGLKRGDATMPFWMTSIRPRFQTFREG